MGKMNLNSLLQKIRQNIVNAIDTRNRKTLGELYIALSIIREAAYQSGDEPFIHVIIALEGVAQNGAMGVGIKAELPSVEDIQNACL